MREPGDEHEGRLATRGPLHLEATVRVLQRRPTNRVDAWERGRYLRVLRREPNLSLIEVENLGTVGAPDLRYRIRHGVLEPSGRAELELMLRQLLGLDRNPDPFQRLAEAEPTLQTTARALRGMRAPRFLDLFEAFANVVPFQQVSLDAGAAVVGRLVERFGARLEHDGSRFYAFPRAATIAEAQVAALRDCGLSMRKAEVLRALAHRVASGELSTEALLALRTDDAIAALRALPGIGPWSASLVLLRGLGRVDVFPPADVGAARGIRSLLQLASDAPIDPFVARFGATRGYLYFYALAGSLLARGLIQPAPDA